MNRRKFIARAVASAAAMVIAPKLLGCSRDTYITLKANEVLADRHFKNQTVYVRFAGNGGKVTRCHFDNTHGPDVALSVRVANGVDAQSCSITDCAVIGNGRKKYSERETKERNQAFFRHIANRVAVTTKEGLRIR